MHWCTDTVSYTEMRQKYNSKQADTTLTSIVGLAVPIAPLPFVLLALASVAEGDAVPLVAVSLDPVAVGGPVPEGRVVYMLENVGLFATRSTKI